MVMMIMMTKLHGGKLEATAVLHSMLIRSPPLHRRDNVGKENDNENPQENDTL